MAGANHEFVGENNPANHQNQSDGVETSVTPEGSAAHAQATLLDVPPPHQAPQPEDPLVVPQVAQGAPMEVVMAALQNRRIRAVEDSHAASKISRSVRRKRSPTPENNRSRSRSRSPRPAPRRNAERPLSPPRENPRRKNHSPPQRNNRNSPPRNKRSPPRKNNRLPPKNGVVAARGGNARHSPRMESSGSGDKRHRGPLSRRIMDIPLPRGLEKPPTLDKYDGTTDPDEHVQSVETALDYRNLRGSIKCKLFPLSLVRGASTWWRNLPSGSIDSWEELCRMFTAHFTTSRFNKVSVEIEATEKMKLYILEEGLREGTKFQEAVGIVEVQTLDAFFESAQRYIKWEDKQKASEVRRPRNFEVEGPSSQREERRGDEKKREGGKVREAKQPKSQFTYHTPLNAPRDMILSEISSAEFKSAGISYGHVTDDCVHLKDAIEILIQKGYSRQYIDGQPRTANNAPRQNQLAVDPASPEQPAEEENRALDYLAAHLDGSWENFPGALVISGGGFNPVTIGSIKRKFDELEKASPVGEIKITEVKESSVPLAFYREEVPGGSPNFQIPLLARAKMANFDVRRILVDQGSSCDIMYSGLFKVLQLTEENLVPYVGSDLQGFNGSTTKPWGYVDLIVTFGENKAMKSVKVKFLVVECPSLYNCIIGRPTLAELFAVSSTIHLKLKYYTKDGQVATINGDIEAVRRCFEAAYKNLNSVVTPKKKKDETKLPGVNSITTEDTVELDARTSKKERKQEKKAIKDDLLIKENYRPIPDGEFELVPLGEDPTKGVNIGADLPDLVKRQLKACLRENAKLFAWSAAEMPGIDPEVACHQLTIDPRASAVVQRRRKQSPEKAEAARKAVKDLQRPISLLKPNRQPGFLMLYLSKNLMESGVCVTYQRMMNKVFHNEIGDMLEFYMDDMIVKSEEEIDHIVHLKRVFDQARKFNMRFNPEKCTFGVKAGKFLSFYLTERGIEANPDKCRAFFDYPTPKSKKSIQTLNGLLTSMARFVAKSAQHALPLFKLLRKETTFEWTEECEGASNEHSSEAISAVLIRETKQGQKPVYFVSRALQGPELRYLQIEKIALAVIMAARKLRYYFLAHSIVIRTDQPVKQLLARPDMVGRMLKWLLELAEFDISFESRKALKAQVLADFVAEMTTSTTSEKNKWTIFVDGSSNSQGSGADIILENGDGVLIEVSLGLSFPTTNNQAEYEVFLAGLRLAEDMGAEEIKIFTDSQLVASQVSGEYQTKEERLLEYLTLIKTKLAKFKETKVKHVPREHNARAYVLSKLASTRRKKAGNQSLLQETLTRPSIEKAVEVMHICAINDHSWMASLYRRGFSIPLLKCVEETRVEFILQEIHEGINGQHIGGRSLARKALRAGYYWPTMQNDAKYHVLKCDKCQRHGDMHIAQANKLKTLISPWPFAWWGMDILGPFPTAARQVKYLIVAFTNRKFQEFLAAIGTTQHFTSVEHPQTNGKAEAANRVTLRGLRRRMGASKGSWTEELHNVLWSYRTTPHSTTGETPFRLTYGTEAVIPVEMGGLSPRIEYPHEENINDELLREELDLVEELRTGASLREATLKQKIAARHDKRVIKREFEVGSLVLRRNQKDSREGKLAANWEGPYRVRTKTENRAYHLEDLYSKEIPRTLKAEKLKQYYSTGRNLKTLKLELSSNADVHAQRENTPCEPHRCLVHARQNAQLAMGCSMLREKISNEETFLDSSLGASQTLVQFHKLLDNGAYDPRHQEETVLIRRALAQRVIHLANRTSKNLPS
ncbi:hypothetical protein TSUD_401460 [Trifolium subterraneum]|uniref:Uncharacterized protein n=1 Tax=Trifolium subterraneum TaxID=3900 RepID=A0A2Z6NP82_TRISU|nr:hypothetical protein TSUD_401460 [Trifolium subterraneum]